MKPSPVEQMRETVPTDAELDRVYGNVFQVFTWAMENGCPYRIGINADDPTYLWVWALTGARHHRQFTLSEVSE